MAKLPAFQFYPADWKKDIKVQSLSFEERGIWFEILCLMHESEERGKLVINKKPMDEITISRLIGCELPMLQKSLKKILDLGVAYKDKNEIIYNKRMINDEKILKFRRKNGKKGGNPALLKRSTVKDLKPILNQTNNHTSNQNTTPSASASSSSSTSVINKQQVFEFLRVATLPTVTDWQIENETEKFLEKYQGMKIGSLRALCNTWANGIKPEFKKMHI